MKLSNSLTATTRVIFFQVRDPMAKLKKICETAQSHFEKRDSLLILVEDERAEKFVDELLWKLPETSFLPHAIATLPTSEKIAITRVKKNLNEARIAFNLCPTPLSIDGPFKIIYELEDLTAPSKQKFSVLRFDAYKKMGFPIEAR